MRIISVCVCAKSAAGILNTHILHVIYYVEDIIWFPRDVEYCTYRRTRVYILYYTEPATVKTLGDTPSCSGLLTIDDESCRYVRMYNNIYIILLLIWKGCGWGYTGWSNWRKTHIILFLQKTLTFENNTFCIILSCYKIHRIWKKIKFFNTFHRCNFFKSFFSSFWIKIVYIFDFIFWYRILFRVFRSIKIKFQTSNLL